MSRKYLTPIDLNQNELQNAVLQPLGTAPSKPKEGQFYYNSTDKKMYQWNGTEWISNGVTYILSEGEHYASGFVIKMTGDDGSEQTLLIPHIKDESAPGGGLIDENAYDHIPFSFRTGYTTGDGNPRGLLNFYNKDGMGIGGGFFLEPADKNYLGIDITTPMDNYPGHAGLQFIVKTDDEISADATHLATSAAVKKYVDATKEDVNSEINTLKKEIHDVETAQINIYTGDTTGANKVTGDLDELFACENEAEIMSKAVLFKDTATEYTWDVDRVQISLDGDSFFGNNGPTIILWGWIYEMTIHQVVDPNGIASYSSLLAKRRDITTAIIKPVTEDDTYTTPVGIDSVGLLHAKIDSEMSDSSTLPVQNKVVKKYIDDNVYTHPTIAGNKHIPAGGASGQILGYDSAGTAKWLTPSKSLVGLGNVDDTSDADKPISTATQEVLDTKAPKASPNFTGTPKAPTAAAGTNTTQIATTAFVKTALDNAIASLPADQFLDMNKTKYVDSFAWSSTTYPGSTNPSLEGKPVLVLALTDGTNVTYSFVSLNDLVDVYTGTAPITVSGGKVSHNDSGATAGSYGEPSARTTEGGQIVVPYITVDAKGHISSIKDTRISIPTGKDLASIPIGETSVTVTLSGTRRISSYCAYMGDEEVIIDLTRNQSGYTFSIATAQESVITIVYESADIH